MAKSPFKLNYITIHFVAPPQGGVQHIFQVSPNQIGITERQPRAFCNVTAADIHKDPKGYVDVVESKDRFQDRELCPKCEDKYKKHPRSPWKVWTQSVKAG